VINKLYFLSQKKLYEAFQNQNEGKFDYWLEYGANPEHNFDQAKDISTFEQLCCESGASEYILKCLDFKADPNKVRIFIADWIVFVWKNLSRYK
jgi:hypothetical protein